MRFGGLGGWEWIVICVVSGLIPMVIIVAIVYIYRLKRRVDEIHQKLTELERRIK